MPPFFFYPLLCDISLTANGIVCIMRFRQSGDPFFLSPTCICAFSFSVVNAGVKNMCIKLRFMCLPAKHVSKMVSDEMYKATEFLFFFAWGGGGYLVMMTATEPILCLCPKSHCDSSGYEDVWKL